MTGVWEGARIGVFGGTFDPPHAGHVQMVAAARDVLGLDHVIVSPAGDPPHKRDPDVSAFRHRHAMAALAFEGEPRVTVTDLEEHAQPSFTVDLLRACRERTPADLYFIMGADSLADLPLWRAPEDILGLCTLVVFPRGSAALRLEVEGDARVIVFESPLVDVSSTGVRRAVQSGSAPAGTLPERVVAYIARNSLY